MTFRHLLFLAAAITATALPSEALAKEGAITDNLTVVHVFTGWRDAASFKRISEYFSGQENTGGEIVVRTHADQRAGYYFLVRITNPGAPTTVKVNVEIITPTDAKTKSYTFTADLKSGPSVLNLGLTGADWTDATANPVAWKLEVIAADGRVLATEKSYLWEKPVAP